MFCNILFLAATAMKVVTVTELLDLVRGFCLGSLPLALLNRLTDWRAPEGDVRARHKVPCYNRQGRLVCTHYSLCKVEFGSILNSFGHHF